MIQYKLIKVTFIAELKVQLVDFKKRNPKMTAVF